VSAPEELTTSGWRRVAAPLVSVVFLATMTGAGLVDSFAPAPEVALSRRDRIAREREWAEASVWDGSWMSYVGRERQERANLRQALVPWYITMVLFPLREGGSGIVVGRDGWLFMADRITPRLTGHRADNPTLTANLLSAYDRRLAGLGIETVFMPIPRKGTITPEFLPPGADVRPEIEETILRSLEQRRVLHVNCFDEWRGRETRDLWQRRDTHWTGLARWLAFEAATRELGLWVPPEERTSELIEDSLDVDHAKLLVTLGIPRQHPVRSQLEPDVLPAPSVRSRPTDAADDGDAEIVIVGTSFSDGKSSTELVAHATNRPVLNLGEGGAKAVTTLRQCLAADSIPADAALLLEWPVFQMLPIQRSPAGKGRIDPNLTALLTQAAPPTWSALPMQLPDVRTRQARIKPRHLATSGDGIVHLELSGRPAGADKLTTSLSMAGYVLLTYWPPEQERLHLPLIAPGPGASDVRLVLRDAPAGSEFGLRLVTELDLPGALDLPEAPIKRRPNGWYQDRALPAGILDSRHAAVWVELDTGGPSGMLEVKLVSDGDEAPHRIATVPLVAGGTALLRASAPERPWTALRITGRGASPARVGAVRIADLPTR